MKILFLIDPGHGATFPKGHEREGEYTTRGKRSPKWDDKTFCDGSPFVLYEGVNNRDNAQRLLEAMELHNLDAIDIVNDWRDISVQLESTRHGRTLWRVFSDGRRTVSRSPAAFARSRI